MMEPWGSAIREYGKDLSEMGFSVWIPNYFDKTGTMPGLASVMQSLNLAAWTEAVADACTHARTIAGSSGLAPGLLGFSLGGNICLRLRGVTRALVEFFAPELTEVGGIGVASGSEKPPVQIHHGLADAVVPFSDTEAIAEILSGEGIKAQVFKYESAGHGFAGSDAANAMASRISKDRTLDFFTKTMLAS
jgi:dienelactone hydrolase